MGYKNEELLINSTFHNRCRYCDKCCHSEKIIIVSPVDLYLIHSNTRGFNFDDSFMITQKYSDKFPLVTLKRTNGNCVYINKDGECNLGEAKPHQCSILPIAKKLVMPQDEFRYYYSSAQKCINRKKVSSIEIVDSFLNNKCNTYEKASDNWYRAYYKLTNLCGGFNNLINKLHPTILAKLQDILINVLYKSISEISTNDIEEACLLLDEKYMIAQLVISEAEIIQNHIESLVKEIIPIWRRKNKDFFKDFTFLTPTIENILKSYEDKFSHSRLIDVQAHEIDYDDKGNKNIFKRILKIFFKKGITHS